METDGWQRIKELFNQALDLDPSTRAKLLEDLRSRDPSLADEVSSLLLSHEDTGTLFDELPSSEDLFGESEPRDNLDRFLGATVGPYLIDGRIGRGGTSSVFLATRTDGSGERVAVKLLEPKRSQDVSIERFFDERQILAHLNHPHIARLVDGGQTDDGIHYLVMELVEGVAIDSYCDDQHLDLDTRLRLVRQVCSAVHYAHRNLVVHRDLKPTNILVTRHGTPKLLDFGIAKLLNSDYTPTTGRTRSSRAPMTPDFASPEQFLGEPVSTASDVYSLGVILYRLVTGRSPYEPEGPTLAELARLVVTDVPVAPSARVATRHEEEHGLDDWTFPETCAALARRLKGDIDAILAMALQKNPELRYSSAEALADDLRRLERGLPIRARGDSLGYISALWLRRHRTATIAVGAVILAGLGAGTLTWRERSAAEHRERSSELLEELAATAGLLDLTDIREPEGQGADRSEEAELVRLARARLEQLASEPSADPTVNIELAQAFLRLGEVQLQLAQGESENEKSAVQTEAAHSFERSLELARGFGDQPSGPISRWAETKAAALEGLIPILFATEDLDEASRLVTELLALRESQLAADPADTEHREDLAEAHLMLADLEQQQGRRDRAKSSYSRAAELLERVLAEDSADRDTRRRLVYACEAAGRAFEAWDEPQEALARFRQVLDLGRSLPDLSASEQVRQARAGLAVGRLEARLANEANEPERRRRLELARHQLGHALTLADELSRLGPLGEAGADLIADLRGAMASVEQALGAYE